MPVSTENSISGPYTPNGVTTEFAFDFKATAANEVVALDQDGETISTALYSVTLDDDEGGTLSFSVAPVLTDYSQIFIAGNPALTQPSDFDNAGPSFNPAALTRALDRAAARDLRQQREIDRSLKVAFGEQAAALPPPAARKGKFLGFSTADGSPVVTDGPSIQAEFSGFATRTAIKALTAVDNARAYLTEAGRAGDWVFYDRDLSAEVAADPSEAMFFAPDSDPTGASGAWGRQYRGAMQATWWGVKADSSIAGGGTNDSASVQAALNYLKARPGTLEFPAGKIRLDSGVVYSGNKGTIRGQGRYATQFIGTFAAGDIFTVDGTVGGGSAAIGFHIESIGVDSSVQKTSGAGWRFNQCARFSVINTVAAGQDGTNNLWDGYSFENYDDCQFLIVQSRQQNTGVASWANATGARASGMRMQYGKIGGDGIGLHLSGDNGGFTLRDFDLNNNDVASCVIDQALGGVPNREIFFGSGVNFDGESVGGVRISDGLVINDPGLPHLMMVNPWFSVNKIGVHIKSVAPTAHIQINGGRIGQSDSDGIRIDAPCLLTLSGPLLIDQNTGFGINATVDIGNMGDADGIVIGADVVLEDNAAGSVNYEKVPMCPLRQELFRIADNDFVRFRPRDLTTLGSSGLMQIDRVNSATGALFRFRTDPSGASIRSIDANGVTFTTGALNGTTGVDGNLTISAHTDEFIYIENRLGAQVSITTALLAAYPMNTSGVGP